jgi:hypothetical protein
MMNNATPWNRLYNLGKPSIASGAAALMMALTALVVPVSTVAAQADAPCTIRTVNGHYLTALGGQTSNAIYTNATQANDLEHFALEVVGGIPVIKTVDGFYLTAVDGGGRTSDVIHTNATQAQAWERFDFEYLGPGGDGDWYAIKTVNGHYLTALGGGGHGAEVPETLHSDATKVNSWEKFKLFCQGGGGNPVCLRGAILC